MSEIPSTNEYLKQELSKSTPLDEGTVIMAVRQTAGRGQRGTSWESEAGKNLTVSILLRPGFLEAQHQFLLNMAVSIALARTLGEFVSEPVHIKWPNDVLVNERKIAGILIENQVQGKRLKSAVIGLGINVNQETFGPQAGERATSLKIVTGAGHDLGMLLSRLCHYIGQAYGLLQQKQHDELRLQYTKRLFALGEKRAFRIHGGRKVEGKIVGVSPHGRLLVDFDGEQADFGLKEIAYVF